MIKFKETDKRQFDIIRINENKEEKNIISLNLCFSPITNKFFRLTEFIEDCSSKLGNEFDEWFCNFLTEYKKSNCNYKVIKDNLEPLMSYCDKYLELCNINFEGYINKSKTSKNSIFFDAEDIKKIIQVSNYLKIYFIIYQDYNLRLNTNFHKKIYNELTKKISSENIIYKLFKIVSSKTYEYNHTDKYMWDYIKTIYCKTTDMHISSIFNFLMNNILVTCSTQSNPIPYLISVIDESIKWILKNVYKDAVVYSDNINTQDTYTVQGKDNLESYSYNDTIGRLLITSYNILEEIGIEEIEKFKNTLSGLKEISLFSNYITYPILSKILDIPYRHFLTISVNNSYLLNILLYHYLPVEFKNKFPVITKMLLYYNKEKPILKTTYKIKNIQTFTKTLGVFLTFKNNSYPYDLYSSIIGKLSRNTYASFLNNHDIVNFPLAKLESNIIEFYNDYFNERNDELYKQIKEKIDKSL